LAEQERVRLAANAAPMNFAHPPLGITSAANHESLQQVRA